MDVAIALVGLIALVVAVDVGRSLGPRRLPPPPPDPTVTTTQKIIVDLDRRS